MRYFLYKNIKNALLDYVVLLLKKGWYIAWGKKDQEVCTKELTFEMKGKLNSSLCISSPENMFIGFFRESKSSGGGWADREREHQYEKLIGCLPCLPWLGMELATQACALARIWPTTFFCAPNYAKTNWASWLGPASIFTWRGQSEIALNSSFQNWITESISDGMNLSK